MAGPVARDEAVNRYALGAMGQHVELEELVLLELAVAVP
jgi:hypothetical protein